MRGPYVDESLFNTTGRVSTPGSPFGAGRGAVAKPQTTRASPALSSRGRAPSAGGDPRNESPRQPWRPSSRTGSIASPRTIGRKYETKLRKGGAKAEVDETLFVSKRMTPQESHVMAYTASEIRGPTTLDGVDLSIKAKEIPARPKAKPSDRIIDGFCNLPGYATKKKKPQYSPRACVCFHLAPCTLQLGERINPDGAPLTHPATHSSLCFDSGKANNPARFSATKTLEGGVGDGIAAARPSNPSINQRPVGKQLLQHTAHHRPRAPKTASAPASTGIFTHANNEFHMSSKPVTKLQNNIYAHMPDV